jgi:hypothetical protein
MPQTFRHMRRRDVLQNDELIIKGLELGFLDLLEPVPKLIDCALTFPA